MIYFFGDYDERHEIALLQRLLAPGDVFWDVGANLGFYSLTASGLVGPQGTVVAFEPGPQSWRALMANINLNRRLNIIPFKMAAAADSGWVTLYSQPELADGGASIMPRAEPSLRADLCPATSLDHFRRKFGGKPPTLVKIDVEGAESQVLAGGRQLLAHRDPPLLLIEMNQRQTLSQFLQDLGFGGVHLIRRRWYVAQDPNMARSRNMLWFHPDCKWHRQRLARVPVLNG